MQPQKKSFNEPDKQMVISRSVVDIVELKGVTHKRITFDAGWQWSDDVSLSEEDKLCSLQHDFIHLSGTLRIKMSDHSEYEFVAGDVSSIPPGHDAWVVGNEPVVVIDRTPEKTSSN